MTARDLARELRSVNRFDRHAYMRALEEVDFDTALQIVRRCLERGVPRDAIVGDLLGPLQEEIGERWEEGRCSVADEHAASGITESVVTALSFDRPAAQCGAVVMACVEHEWHSLPARMAGLLLADRGWQVTLLGASVPAEDIGRFTEGRSLAGLAVSCSTPATLLPARRMIEAAHAKGLRVLAGGRGFGTDGERARRLGADGWGANVEHAHRTLQAWQERPAGGPLVEPPLDREAETIAESTHELAIGMAEELAAAGAEHAGSLTRLLEDGGRALQMIASAAIVDEPGIVGEHIRWLRGVSAARYGEGRYVDTLIRALRAALKELPGTGRILPVLT
ncbi:MAG TPA: cobalamin-dependent protein [Actinomycetota bacterium]|nr:cobalamin-dependent protein [Actinomycetota bacterium]